MTAESGARHQHGFRESTLGAGDQPPVFFGNIAHGNGLRGVGHESIFLYGDIELKQIAGLNRAVARDAVYRFLIQADAIHSGKLVDQLRRGSRSVLAHDGSADCIQFASGDAETHCALHGFEHAADDCSRCAHSGEVFGAIDGHASSLSHRIGGVDRKTA
jgi:hypothetical protein